VIYRGVIGRLGDVVVGLFATVAFIWIAVFGLEFGEVPETDLLGPFFTVAIFYQYYETLELINCSKRAISNHRNKRCYLKLIYRFYYSAFWIAKENFAYNLS
jgi:hypothetical protein